MVTLEFGFEPVGQDPGALIGREVADRRGNALNAHRHRSGTDRRPLYSEPPTGAGREQRWRRWPRACPRPYAATEGAVRSDDCRKDPSRPPITFGHLFFVTDTVSAKPDPVNGGTRCVRQLIVPDRRVRAENAPRGMRRTCRFSPPTACVRGRRRCFARGQSPKPSPSASAMTRKTSVLSIWPRTRSLPGPTAVRTTSSPECTSALIIAGRLPKRSTAPGTFL